MKTLILFLLMLFAISCSENATSFDPTTDEITKKLTSDSKMFRMEYYELAKKYLEPEAFIYEGIKEDLNKINSEYAYEVQKGYYVSYNPSQVTLIDTMLVNANSMTEIYNLNYKGITVAYNSKWMIRILIYGK